MTLRDKVVLGLGGVVTLLLAFLVFQKGAPSTTFGAYTPVTDYQVRTTSYISETASTIPVSGVTDRAGNAITMANLGGSRAYFTLEPGNPSKEEAVYCTGISGSSWTGCVRGLPFQGGDLNASTTLQHTHNAGSVFLMTNTSQFYTEYASLNSIALFNVYPKFAATTTVPTLGAQFATKYYVDQVGAGGMTSANVSSTMGVIANGTVPETFGIHLLATSTNSCGHLGGGLLFDPTGSCALVLNASSTGGIIIDSNGKVAIDTTDQLTWTATTTFSIPPIDSSGGYVGVPPGVVNAYVTSTPPTGWLACNGAAVSRTTYARLFAVLGTVYGVGDNSTTFNLPDLRGKTTFMASSTITGFTTYGFTAGTSSHVQTVAELAAHTHTAVTNNGGSGAQTTLGALATNVLNTAPYTVPSAGGSAAMDLMNPYMVMNYIIKY